MWLHVDAAYAGSAALCPEYRWCLDGCDRADSFVFNPHKWLFTPIDASALYTRHPEIFKRAFSLVPEYLTTPVSGRVVDLMDYGVQLGRRFRALKLWWVLRCFGLEGVHERIRSHIGWRTLLQIGWTPTENSNGSRRRRSRSSASAPVRTGSMAKPSTVSTWSSWNTSTPPARSILSHTRLDGGVSLRVAIGNLATVDSDVDRCRELLTEGLSCLSNR